MQIHVCFFPAGRLRLHGEHLTLGRTVSSTPGLEKSRFMPAAELQAEVLIEPRVNQNLFGLHYH